jgi:cation transport ATPase
MIQIYKVLGITCAGCQAKIKYLFSSVAGVENVEVDLATGSTEIQSKQSIDKERFREALKPFPKYQLVDEVIDIPKPKVEIKIEEEVQKSWLATYKPILLIFAYILLISLILSSLNGVFDLMLGMRVFMSGFFLVFSFFKMLNLAAFAESYAMYDIIAKKVKAWGYIYVFIELGLGLTFLLDFQPIITNWMAFIVMSISIIGVLESVLNKRKIRCACLGAVFNLPMSTVTIIEDALMIGMSATMLILMS